ncbi:MAG: hypothetical protein Q7O66_22350 [Dehalococcoidia bacterium]|nr:hypothetical protein [Dehalococcoidia bacterium]
MTTARSGFAAVVIGDYLYAIGGWGPSSSIAGVGESTVERARINPDRTLGAWTPAASMTIGRYAFATFTAGNYLYALGGNVKQGSASVTSDTVERSSVNPDGSISSWQIIGSMPTGRNSFAAVYAGGALFVLGGGLAGGSPDILNTVDSAPMNSDGSIGPWQSCLQCLPVGTFLAQLQ